MPLRRVVAIAASVVLAAAIVYACTDVSGPGSANVDPPTLTVEALGPNAIRVTWEHDPSAGIKSYLLERRADLTGGFTRVVELSPSTTGPVVHVDSDVDPGTFYGYRARSMARLGAMSEPSKIVGARTSPPPGIALTVTMEAPDPEYGDQDGFTALLEGPSPHEATVAPGATTTIAPLLPGEYVLTIGGVREGCSVVGGPSRTVTVTDTGLATVVEVRLDVVCRDPTLGAITVAVTTIGDTMPQTPYTARVVGTPEGEPLVVTESMQPGGPPGHHTTDPRLANLEPGEYEVSLIDVDVTICDIEGEAVRTVQVTPLSNDTIRYNVACSRGDVDNDAPLVLRQEWVPAQASTGQSVRLFLRYDGGTRPELEVCAVGYTVLFDTTLVRADSVAPGPGLTLFAVNLSMPGRLTADIGCAELESKTDTATFASMAFTVRGPPGSSARTITPKNEFSGFSDGGGDITAPPDSVRIVEDTLQIVAPQQENLPPTVAAGGPYTGTAGVPVAFAATGSDPDGSIKSWNWSFGDGGSAASQSTSHTYSAAGSYTAHVTVTDDFGATATDSAQVTISADTTTPPGNEPEQYAWHNEFSADSVTAGEQFTLRTFHKPPVPLYIVEGGVSFDSTVVRIDSLRADPFWTTGGGIFASNLVDAGFVRLSGARLDNAAPNNPAVPVQLVTMYLTAIGAAGASTTTLTTGAVLGAQGGSQIESLPIIEDTIRIAGGGSSEPPPNQPPVVNINGPYEGTVNEPLLLRATGTTDPDGDELTYRWDYGDGTISGLLASPLVPHIYTAAGTFTVRLTVRDDRGASTSDSTTVTIAVGSTEPITAEANGPYTGIVGSPIAFTASGSTGSITSHDWAFGDGATGSGADAFHTYSATGIYIVTLTVRSAMGDTAVDTAQVTVSSDTTPPSPIPVAEANGPYTGTIGVPVEFGSAGSSDADGEIVGYAWTFGDGAIDTVANPQHAYDSTGTYMARLVVTDDDGNTSADSAVVTIEPPATFALRNEWSAASAAVGEIVSLSITTKPGVTVGAAQASILFDSAVLRADSVQQGDFAPPVSNLSTPGIATVSATSLTGLEGEPVVARVFFTVIGSGTVMTNTPRSEVAIGNLSGDPIDVSGLPILEATLTAGN